MARHFVTYASVRIVPLPPAARPGEAQEEDEKKFSKIFPCIEKFVFRYKHVTSFLVLYLML
jgi:hypothetical protein